MPITTIKPEVDFPPTPVLPQAQSKNYMGLTYDNNNTPLVSLTAYVEGAPWTVTYYRQILGAHNDLKEIDPNLGIAYQSYSRIDQLEIRVQSDLDGSTDGSTQNTDVTGSAMTYGFFQPNVNDYFITDTGYNRQGLFRITEVDRQTWRRQSVFLIQYKLVDYVEFLSEDVADLNRKTTTTYVFSRERFMEGLTPYLKTEDYELVTDLRGARKRIGDYYFNAFSVNACKTLVFPGQNTRIYDSFLVDFVMATCGYLEFPQAFHIKQLPKSGDPYLEQPQFWDAILNRDINLIEYGNQVMKVAWTAEFPKNSYVKGLYNARMDAIVYPFKPDVSTVTGDDTLPRPVFTERLTPTTNSNGKILTDDEKSYELLGRKILAYPPANKDGYYVLSQAFYEDRSQDMTLLEIMTRDYLRSKTLDVKQLTFFIHLYPKMERMEQLYFGPLLLCLIKYADQRVYS